MRLTPRALHQAARQRLNERFDGEWLSRQPFSDLHPSFLERVRALPSWPAPESYDELARLVPQTRPLLPRFVTQDRDALRRAGGYEQLVGSYGQVPTRPSDWHDFFNMVVWAHFPRLRWALNAVHVDRTHGPPDPRNGRTLPQSLAAQFDECGMIVVSSSQSLLEDLRALSFKRVFWERRAELLETTRFWLVGHGLLESLLAPHLGLAAKAVLLHRDQPGAREQAGREALDLEIAAQVGRWRDDPIRLDPVPVLGIPGHAANDFAEFYDDPRYFRFQRRGGGG